MLGRRALEERYKAAEEAKALKQRELQAAQKAAQVLFHVFMFHVFMS
jgi:hypothetical protein